MAHYPGAVWLPLARDESHQSLMARHDVVCLHTMVGSLAGTDSYFDVGGYSGTESHFGVGGDGTVHQYTDTARTADANLDGNFRVLSIETADMGDPFPKWSGSNVPPWTDAQLEAISALVAWLCALYEIPADLVPDSRPEHRGIAYHRQGIDGNYPGPYKGRQGVGEHWSTSTGKTCPGDNRIAQLSSDVIPRVRELLTGDDMAISDDDLAKIGTMIDQRLAPIGKALDTFRGNIGDRDHAAVARDRSLADQLSQIHDAIAQRK